MTQLKYQNDNEHLDLLNVTNIKRFVLKKCCHHFQETKLFDSYFRNDV
jgi:hypothetical protein